VWKDETTLLAWETAEQIGEQIGIPWEHVEEIADAIASAIVKAIEATRTT